jgi:hypothetical protein
MLNADRIKNIINNTLMFVEASVDVSCPVVHYVDVKNEHMTVSIECCEDNTYGVIVDRGPNQMSQYFYDNYIEAIDIAIKILCDW